MKPLAILSNRLYVPTDIVTPEHRREFTFVVGRDESDEPIQEFNLYRDYGDGWTGFHRGDLGKIKRLFRDYVRLKDERSYPTLGYPLKFVQKLRSNQMQPVQDYLRHGYGHLVAPPRSGKTVMMCSIICELHTPTLVLASQKEWLEQFILRMNAFTNIKSVENFQGRKILGFAKTESDYMRFDIVASTYQKFLSPKGKKLLSSIRDRFGFVIVDEADQASALQFSKVVAQLNPKYRMGCTATPDRKDEIDFVAKHVIGPVMAIGTSDQVPCQVHIHHTGHMVKPFHQFHTFYRRLVSDENRNRLIVKNIVQSVQEGNYVVAVTNRLEHIATLVKMLKEKGVVAEGYWGKSPTRNTFLERANAGQIRVVIAYRGMIQRGLDVPPWNDYHCLIPIGNIYNYTQEVARVRTPSATKKVAHVHYYMDAGHKVVHALAQTVHNVHHKENFTYVEQVRNEIPRVGKSQFA